MTGQADPDPRFFLAAQRTFLAWIRTGLSLMGFGFVVARFGLFLREMQLAQAALTQQYGFSLWFGTVLVVVGVVVNIVASVDHLRTVQKLRQGETFSRPSYFAISVAGAVALVGVAMAIYLVSVR